MRFCDIKGNEDVKHALVSMADSGRVAHAVLFYENEGCGALALALAYIQYLNCENPENGESCGKCRSCHQMAGLVHPDVHFVFPVNSGSKIGASEKPVSDSYLKYWRELVLDNPYFLENDLYEALGLDGKAGNIAVAEAKSILEKLSLTSVGNGYKTVVLWLPEKMNAETANRLLKIVEEPPEKTLFLFVTHSPEKVLQTVFSRCQSIRVLPLSKSEIAGLLADKFGAGPELSDELAAAAGGSPGRAVQLLRNSDDRRNYMDIFSGIMSAVVSRDLLQALEAVEVLSSAASREKQKGFCIFASECVRKIFLMQQNLPAIANTSEDEKEFLARVSRKCGKRFCQVVAAATDKASALLDRNVNPKIVFCDLVDRMFVSL